MPTIRQQEAFNEYLRKPNSMSKIMRKVGYSEGSAKVSTDLTRSKGWRELVEKQLTDKKLLKVHSEGLEATKIQNKQELPDYAVRHKYLETAYKIKTKIDVQDESAPKLSQNILVLIKKIYGTTTDRYGKLIEDPKP